MKNYKFLLFSLLMLALTVPGAVSAQHGNTVISAVNAFDNNDGTGTLEVRVSGRDAEFADSYNIALRSGRVGGLCVLSGTIRSSASGGPSNHTNLITVTFPLLPSTGSGPDPVDIELRVRVVPESLSRGGYFLNYDNTTGEFFKR